MALLGCHPQLQSGVLVVSGAAPRRPPRGLIPGEEAALCPMLTTSSHLIIDPGLCSVCLWTALGWGLFDGQRGGSCGLGQGYAVPRRRSYLKRRPDEETLEEET